MKFDEKPAGGYKREHIREEMYESLPELAK